MAGLFTHRSFILDLYGSSLYLSPKPEKRGKVPLSVFGALTKIIRIENEGIYMVTHHYI